MKITRNCIVCDKLLQLDFDPDADNRLDCCNITYTYLGGKTSYYVDSVLGNDKNDGLSVSTPFKTCNAIVQHANDMDHITCSISKKTKKYAISLYHYDNVAEITDLKKHYHYVIPDASEKLFRMNDDQIEELLILY